MKKLYTLVCLLVAAMAANAQFDSSYTVIDSSQTCTVQKWLSVFEQIPTDSAHTGLNLEPVRSSLALARQMGIKLRTSNS